MGNLTKDVEIRTTGSGQKVAKFMIAVNREPSKGEMGKVDFLRISAWGRLAEVCADFLSKGKKVCVVGSIENSSFVGHDGQRRFMTEIAAEKIEFLSPKKTSANDDDDEARSACAKVVSELGEVETILKSDIEGLKPAIDDDTIPF